MNWRIIFLGVLLLIMVFSSIYIAAPFSQMGQQEVNNPQGQCRNNPTLPNAGGGYGLIVPQCDDVIWDWDIPRA